MPFFEDGKFLFLVSPPLFFSSFFSLQNWGVLVLFGLSRDGMLRTIRHLGSSHASFRSVCLVPVPWCLGFWMDETRMGVLGRECVVWPAGFEALAGLCGYLFVEAGNFRAASPWTWNSRLFCFPPFFLFATQYDTNS